MGETPRINTINLSYLRKFLAEELGLIRESREGGYRRRSWFEEINISIFVDRSYSSRVWP